MSLYNQLFGTNIYAEALLMVLGIKRAAIPRFRDCYLDGDKNIVIFTRTGGPNRPAYDNTETCRAAVPDMFFEGTEAPGPWNDDLRKLPTFLHDRDDTLDDTFAHFVFKPHPDFAEELDTISVKQGPYDPTERMRSLLQELKTADSIDPSPAVRRAMKVGEDVMRQINAGVRIIKA